VSVSNDTTFDHHPGAEYAAGEWRGGAMGRGYTLLTQHCSPRTDGRTYLGETAGPVTLSGCTCGKDRRKVQQRCQWRGNRVGRVAGSSSAGWDWD